MKGVEGGCCKQPLLPSLCVCVLLLVVCSNSGYEGCRGRVLPETASTKRFCVLFLDTSLDLRNVGSVASTQLTLPPDMPVYAAVCVVSL